MFRQLDMKDSFGYNKEYNINLYKRKYINLLYINLLCKYINIAEHVFY